MRLKKEPLPDPNTEPPSATTAPPHEGPLGQEGFREFTAAVSLRAERADVERNHGPHICASLAKSVLVGWLETLITEARARGGHITEAQLVSFLREANALGREELLPMVGEHYACCMEAVEVLGRLRMRQNLVGRLLVEQFVHDFSSGEDDGRDQNQDEDHDKPDHAPPVMIAGFLRTSGRILGSETLRDLNDICLAARDRLYDRDGLGFSWETFFKDDTVRGVLAVVLGLFARYFNSHFEPRRDAFINEMNFAMAKANGGPMPREFCIRSFHRLMLSLFRAFDPSKTYPPAKDRDAINRFLIELGRDIWRSEAWR